MVLEVQKVVLPVVQHQGYLPMALALVVQKVVPVAQVPVAVSLLLMLAMCW